MSIHKQLLDQLPPAVLVKKISNVEFKANEFSILMQSLRLRGLTGASIQPTKYIGHAYKWGGSSVQEGFFIVTAEHPQVYKSPMDIELVGTKGQIQEAMSVLRTMNITGKETPIRESDLEYHTTPNPILWNNTKNGFTLKSDISKVLLDGADKFIEYMKFPSMLAVTDIHITGSSANYNWTATSDIDLHVLVDLSEVDPEYKEVLLEYFKAKKTTWNEEHDIRIHGIPVEYYVQDIAEKHHSTGIYSLQDKEWINFPTHNVPTVNDISVRHKFKQYHDEIATACQSNKAAVIERLHAKIMKIRKVGLEKGGEFDVRNVVFKQLRNSGDLEKLTKCKINTFDRQLSIEDEEWDY